MDNVIFSRNRIVIGGVLAIIALLVAGLLILSNTLQFLKTNLAEADVTIFAQATDNAFQALELKALEALATNSQVEMKVVQSSLQSAQANLNLASEELLKLQASELCSDNASFIADYSSNSAMANALQIYLEETRGSVQEKRWETIWSNSKATIDYLTIMTGGERRLYPFAVFFEEPDTFTSSGVFSFHEQCWLDR